MPINAFGGRACNTFRTTVTTTHNTAEIPKIQVTFVVAAKPC